MLSSDKDENVFVGAALIQIINTHLKRQKSKTLAINTTTDSLIYGALASKTMRD